MESNFDLQRALSQRRFREAQQSEGRIQHLLGLFRKQPGLTVPKDVASFKDDKNKGRRNRYLRKVEYDLRKLLNVLPRLSPEEAQEKLNQICAPPNSYTKRSSS